MEGHLYLLGKDYNNEPTEEVLIQRAVKTAIQVPYNKGLFDNFPNADRVLKVFFPVVRRRSDLKEVNDVIQGFHSKI